MNNWYIVLHMNWRMLMFRVFTKYFVFSKMSKYIPDPGLSRFFLGVYTLCLDH